MQNFVVSLADKKDLKDIYRLRHEVYSDELSQYESKDDGLLPDNENIKSDYIIATHNGELLGFIGITPPTSSRYSVDKFISRKDIPLFFNGNLYEIRALTVKKTSRGSCIASCLIYAAFRWFESRGGKQILAVGRKEVLKTYLRLGMNKLGRSFKCGDVFYELMSIDSEEIEKRIQSFDPILQRIQKCVDWQLDVDFDRPHECYHGGAFFEAIGDTFDDLNRKDDVINADVLDAWFPPAPKIKKVISENLEWIIRTSPPTRSGGLEKEIARARGVNESCILTGGGSSDLIFLAFRQWLSSSSKVLVLDPTYGEYLHVLDNIIKCKVERFLLNRSDGYTVNLESLKDKLSEGFDLFVWVNPNSPTGLHVQKHEVEKVLKEATNCKRIWIDETYVEYVGSHHSHESFAVKSDHVIVCKSLSKVYALSGVRVAYLCASAHHLEQLRLVTPPWSVGLPGQVAATYALNSDSYYLDRYQQTHSLRSHLIAGLRKIGITEIIPGVANFIMFHLRDTDEDAASIVLRCRKAGLYIRDVSGMGSNVGNRAIRIAVKDSTTNAKMLTILDNICNAPS